MSDVLITSDEHYGHANVLKFCNRPFKDVDEMRETLISRHNAKVPNSKNFLTIHVGDMFWRSLAPAEVHAILDRLHGRHAYLLGNHEEVFKLNDYDVRRRFEWVRDVHSLHFNKKLLWLSHYAHQVWPNSHKGSWHLYGHSHGDLEAGQTGFKFDIGVDSHNFEPWYLEEVAEKMSLRTQGDVPVGGHGKGQ